MGTESLVGWELLTQSGNMAKDATASNSFFLLGVLMSVPILAKIDQEMRP